MDPLITHDDPDQSKMIDQDEITELGLKSLSKSPSCQSFRLPPSGGDDYGSLVHQDHGSLFSPLTVAGNRLADLFLSQERLPTWIINIAK
jgi:hypothetical protein